MRLSAEDLMHHPWFADMKTRMKIRPYKPKQTASFRLRKLEEPDAEEPEVRSLSQKSLRKTESAQSLSQKSLRKTESAQSLTGSATRMSTEGSYAPRHACEYDGDTT